MWVYIRIYIYMCIHVYIYICVCSVACFESNSMGSLCVEVPCMPRCVAFRVADKKCRAACALVCQKSQPGLGERG